MTSSAINTTVKYNGGTYTGKIEPYVESRDRRTADVGAAAQPENNLAELINHYDTLIQLIQYFNLNENIFLQKEKVYRMQYELIADLKTTVADFKQKSDKDNINDLNILLTIIDSQIVNLNKQNDILTKIQETDKFISKTDVILDKNNAIEKNRQKITQYTDLKSKYIDKITQLQTKLDKKGGFNKRRHSHHLIPSLKKRKHLTHSHSTTRRKHN